MGEILPPAELCDPVNPASSSDSIWWWVASHFLQPATVRLSSVLFPQLAFPLDGPEIQAEAGGPGADLVFPLAPSDLLLLASISSLDRGVCVCVTQRAGNSESMVTLCLNRKCSTAPRPPFWPLCEMSKGVISFLESSSMVRGEKEENIIRMSIVALHQLHLPTCSKRLCIKDKAKVTSGR